MNNLKKGFSLVELLVVIAIIGILASVGVTTYSGYIESAKQGVVKSNHNSVVSYSIAELARCQLGSGSFAASEQGTNNTEIKCTEVTGTNAATSIKQYIISIAKFENPGTSETYVDAKTAAASGVLTTINETDLTKFATLEDSYCNTDAQMGNIYIFGLDQDPGTDYLQIASCVDPTGTTAAESMISSQRISVE